MTRAAGVEAEQAGVLIPLAGIALVPWISFSKGGGGEKGGGGGGGGEVVVVVVVVGVAITKDRRPEVDRCCGDPLVFDPTA